MSDVATQFVFLDHEPIRYADTRALQLRSEQEIEALRDESLWSPSAHGKSTRSPMGADGSRASSAFQRRGDATITPSTATPTAATARLGRSGAVGFLVASSHELTNVLKEFEDVPEIRERRKIQDELSRDVHRLWYSDKRSAHRMHVQDLNDALTILELEDREETLSDELRSLLTSLKLRRSVTSGSDDDEDGSEWVDEHGKPLSAKVIADIKAAHAVIRKAQSVDRRHDALRAMRERNRSKLGE